MQVCERQVGQQSEAARPRTAVVHADGEGSGTQPLGPGGGAGLWTWQKSTGQWSKMHRRAHGQGHLQQKSPSLRA